MITIDPTNEHSFVTVFPAKSQSTNNTASAGVDLQSFIGQLAIRVNIGVQTAGDNGSTFTVQMQDSATNNASNAANISNLSVVSGGNNAATYSFLMSVDPRAQNRFLFARIIIVGANSPAVPLAVEAIGTKRTQFGSGSPQL
jgi:hypothetical protein